MKSIPERLLHHIWANQLYDALTIGSEEVLVVDPGRHNHSDGPDFLQAQIKWSDLLWVGAIEIHRHAAEWSSHSHHRDPRYTGVVLHVVLTAEEQTTTDASGAPIPTAVMHLGAQLLERIEQLTTAPTALRCTPELLALTPRERTEICDTLVRRRLDDKIEQLTRRSEDGHRGTMLYHTVMRYLGLHRNNDVMERIARSLPYSFLKKHADRLPALEAMLIGQGGLLHDTPRDPYEEELQSLYRFYAHKFGLEPLPPGSFRLLHVRPHARPARLLATAATLMYHEGEVLSLIGKRAEVADFECWLMHPPSDYWLTHSDFGRPSKRKLSGLGAQTRHALIINALIPFAYGYHILLGDDEGAHHDALLLRQLPPESNHIVRIFDDAGFSPQNAWESQALLQAYGTYCEPYRCLQCPIAPAVLCALKR